MDYPDLLSFLASVRASTGTVQLTSRLIGGGGLTARICFGQTEATLELEDTVVGRLTFHPTETNWTTRRGDTTSFPARNHALLNSLRVGITPNPRWVADALRLFESPNETIRSEVKALQERMRNPWTLIVIPGITGFAVSSPVLQIGELVRLPRFTGCVSFRNIAIDLSAGSIALELNILGAEADDTANPDDSLFLYFERPNNPTNPTTSHFQMPGVSFDLKADIAMGFEARGSAFDSKGYHAKIESASIACAHGSGKVRIGASVDCADAILDGLTCRIQNVASRAKGLSSISPEVSTSGGPISVRCSSLTLTQRNPMLLGIDAVISSDSVNNPISVAVLDASATVEFLATALGTEAHVAAVLPFVSLAPVSVKLPGVVLTDLQGRLSISDSHINPNGLCASFEAIGLRAGTLKHLIGQDQSVEHSITVKDATLSVAGSLRSYNHSAPSIEESSLYLDTVRFRASHGTVITALAGSSAAVIFDVTSTLDAGFEGVEFVKRLVGGQPSQSISIARIDLDVDALELATPIDEFRVWERALVDSRYFGTLVLNGVPPAAIENIKQLTVPPGKIGASVFLADFQQLVAKTCADYRRFHHWHKALDRVLTERWVFTELDASLSGFSFRGRVVDAGDLRGQVSIGELNCGFRTTTGFPFPSGSSLHGLKLIQGGRGQLQKLEYDLHSGKAILGAAGVLLAFDDAEIDFGDIAISIPSNGGNNQLRLTANANEPKDMTASATLSVPSGNLTSGSYNVPLQHFVLDAHIVQFNPDLAPSLRTIDYHTLMRFGIAISCAPVRTIDLGKEIKIDGLEVALSTISRILDIVGETTHNDTVEQILGASGNVIDEIGKLNFVSGGLILEGGTVTFSADGTLQDSTSLGFSAEISFKNVRPFVRYKWVDSHLKVRTSDKPAGRKWWRQAGFKVKIGVKVSLALDNAARRVGVSGVRVYIFDGGGTDGWKRDVEKGIQDFIYAYYGVDTFIDNILGSLKDAVSIQFPESWDINEARVSVSGANDVGLAIEANITEWRTAP